MKEQHNHSNSHHVIVPVHYYVKTFVALLFLTFITVAAAQFNFGGWNIPIAMFIAICKALLVCMVFMGLRWDKGVSAVFFMSSFIFLGIFITFTLSDILFRQETDPQEALRFGFKTPVKIEQQVKPVAATSTANATVTANTTK